MSTWPDTIVRGKDVIVYIWDAPLWKLYVCARSCAYRVHTDIIETSVSGSGIWRTKEATANSYDGSIAGIVSLMQTGTLSLADLRLLQYTQTKLLLRYQRTSQAGDIYTEELKVIITESDDEASFDNLNTFSIDFTGTGAPTQIFTITPNPSNTCKVKRFPPVGSKLNTIGGETTIESALLVGKDMIEAFKDGQGKADIILSGTPVGTEALWQESVSGVGRVTFANPFEPGEQGYVIYQDK